MTPVILGPEFIMQAVKALESGQLVSFPTETVYGLGADARNSVAVARIFATKGRPQFNPLIVHVASLKDAEKICILNSDAHLLAEAFWPGPLTIVAPLKPDSGIVQAVTAGLDTIAVRIPVHPVARKLLERAACPVAAPSANVSGRVSPTTAAHVAEDFHLTDLIIVDGGSTSVGIESTVVSCKGTEVHLLRPGSITARDMETVLGRPVLTAPDHPDRPISPGQLLSHYAPVSAVRLNATSVCENEKLLAFGPDVPAGALHVLNLSSAGDTEEAASNLFAMLRELDKKCEGVIAVMPIPDTGAGAAINDRLKKAAAPRDSSRA